MNKDKLFLLSVMLFYLAAGVLACAFFFSRSSSSPGSGTSSPSVSNNIKPKLTQSVLPETTNAPQEIADALPEPSDTLTKASDAVSEADPEESIPEPVYYAFTTLNTLSPLNVRQEPGLDAPVIARFSPGTTGYVLERGSEWSLVKSGDIVGYVFNEYLDFREIPEEEYHSMVSMSANPVSVNTSITASLT